MTVEEYAREVGSRLREAYNNSQRANALSAISDAERDIKASNLDRDTIKLFWDLVWREFNNGRILQKAENSALHNLLREIEGALEAKKSS